MGVVGTVAFGVLAHGEPAGALRLASLVLVLTGIAGVKLATA